jgi:transcriptional regulator with XRE-family HTH domain
MLPETVLPTETEDAENRIAQAITARLREAIPDGDGAEVGRRAGVPYASLREYLRGRQPKPAALVAIARAAGVRLDWLMTGEGPMRADGAGPPGMAEAPAGYRAAPSPPDAIDHANLCWALDFVEKTVTVDPARRVSVMLSAATEFRRVQRMPPLPAFEETILAAALDAAEQLLRAAEQPLDAGRRVDLMLSIYALVAGTQAPR